MNNSKLITFIFVATIFFFSTLTSYNCLKNANTIFIAKNSKINFSNYYPFSEPNHIFSNKTNFYLKLSVIPNQIDKLIKESVPWRDKLCEIQSYINKAIGVNLFLEFDHTYFLNNGYMAYEYPYVKSDTAVNSITNLNQFLKDNNISFTFAIYPCKNCKYNPQLPQGIKDNNNKTADELLNVLTKNNINCLDMREELHKDYDDHYKQFFITDHHWKPQAGLWAARKIGEYLNIKFDYKIPVELLNDKNFIIKDFQNIFFGSQGKKSNLSLCKTRKFVYYNPKLRDLL